MESEATDDSLEPAEVVGKLFCCLAMTATALRNGTDEVNMPGTHAYGSKRTVGLGG